MLVNLNDVLYQALARKCAIPAFNVFGYEDAKAVIDAAAEMGSPVILATNKVAIHHMPIEVIGAMLVEMAKKAAVPVVVHLDHGQNYETAAKAIAAGYSSVMYDGSALPFEENVRNTAEVVKLGHAFGVSVEGEIGSVGYSDSATGNDGTLTDPYEAKVFAEKTKVDALAVAVGTTHRMETQSASIDYHLMEEIQKVVPVPLVMHGSTGLPDNDLQEIAKMNFCKVNIGTAIRMRFGNSLRKAIHDKPEVFDRLELFQSPIKEVKQEAVNKIRLLHANHLTWDED
ncbi:fructose-bisphosphate aldolase, class II [Gracilibacillus ureilyticus]|uniref:Fructose-bisphosphate aldolase, class II n=1 Tax=Gracilibacillus ureilyticus TaxID=531814 RepID=A0A1H9U8V4_9BACI|nr:class II fructose-bisphosphate aldolase [Gracilibacillus ureilyticus]SES05691.1 fructose-bisphosphate aldolase, class II [Gracilibacillus ureilyticus]